MDRDMIKKGVVGDMVEGGFNVWVENGLGGMVGV